jgi:hypothetical protein
MAFIRVKARETILEKYDLAKLLQKHLDWIKDYSGKSHRGVALPRGHFSTATLICEPFLLDS